jgi:hypothetical protein
MDGLIPVSLLEPGECGRRMIKRSFVSHITGLIRWHGSRSAGHYRGRQNRRSQRRKLLRLISSVES